MGLLVVLVIFVIGFASSIPNKKIALSPANIWDAIWDVFKGLGFSEDQSLEPLEFQPMEIPEFQPSESSEPSEPQPSEPSEPSEYQFPQFPQLQFSQPEPTPAETEPGILSVTLTANPNSGTAPLSNVVLFADPSGSATGTINYTFYCNRSDSGTNITPDYPYAHKLDSTKTDPYSAPAGVCDSVYANLGTYTAKVIIERENLQAEARTTITVSAQKGGGGECETDKDCLGIICTQVVGGDKPKCDLSTNTCYCGGVCGDGYCDFVEKRDGTCPQDCIKCSDGTRYGECSTTKPKYCDNGKLVDKCSVCECPSGQQCQPDGSCAEGYCGDLVCDSEREWKPDRCSWDCAEMIVSFKEGTTEDEARGILEEYGLTLVRWFDFISAGVGLINRYPADNVEQIEDDLEKDPRLKQGNHSSLKSSQSLTPDNEAEKALVVLNYGFGWGSVDLTPYGYEGGTIYRSSKWEKGGAVKLDGVTTCFFTGTNSTHTSFHVYIAKMGQVVDGYEREGNVNTGEKVEFIDSLVTPSEDALFPSSAVVSEICLSPDYWTDKEVKEVLDCFRDCVYVREGPCEECDRLCYAERYSKTGQRRNGHGRCDRPCDKEETILSEPFKGPQDDCPKEYPGSDYNCCCRDCNYCMGRWKWPEPKAGTIYDLGEEPENMTCVPGFEVLKIEEENICIPKESSLSVTLTANPNSGTAPLSNVVLTADPSGSATGTINYTFYCNRSDSGTNITPDYPYAHKLDSTKTDPYSAPAGVCDSVYANLGTYTAKVIIERDNLATEARVTVIVK